MDLTEEKKLSNGEIEEIINLYIAQYEEYKKYGSVVAKVSPQFVIKLIRQLQSEKADLTEKLEYFQMSSDYHEGNQKELEDENTKLKAELEQLMRDKNDIMQSYQDLAPTLIEDGEKIEKLEKDKKGLQKQVDELKERVRELITDCDNCPLPRQAVKDTAKYILMELKPYIGDWVLFNQLKEKFGVEAE